MRPCTHLFSSFCTLDTCPIKRLSTTLSTKVNLHHAIRCMAQRGANLVTQRSQFRPNETPVLHWVGWPFSPKLSDPKVYEPWFRCVPCSLQRPLCSKRLELRAQGHEFTVWGLGLGLVLGCRVQGAGCRVWDARCRVSPQEVRVQDRSQGYVPGYLTMEFEGSVASNLEGHATKFAPRKAPMCIAWCEMTFDERVELNRWSPDN